MKLEIDLEKLSRQVQLRKKSEVQETDGEITIQVRQWGEMITASTMIPDDILENQIKMVIEGKILELMMYAPDVSDLKPAKIQVQSNGRVKQASATFYYVSQIADYWHKKIERAKKDAAYAAERQTMWNLYERWQEESAYGKKQNWQAKAAKDMAARLNVEEDDE